MSDLSLDLEQVANAATDLDESPTRRKIGIAPYLAVGWIVLIVLVALLAPVLPLNDPAAQVAQKRLAPFQPGEPLLGTDGTGRDMLARVIFGARMSLLISIASVMIGLVIGGLLGLVSGYYRNWIGNALVSLFDVLLAIPSMVLALSLVSVLKGNPADTESFSIPVPITLIMTLGIVSIPLLARITRASTLSWSQRDFVTAARAQGASNSRILFKEILPNVAPAMLSIALLGVAIAIVAEGGLAILGASVEPPTATWGTMVSTGKAELTVAPFIVWIPVVAIFLTATSFNYLGDVVRDRFDVRESAL